MGHDLFHKHLIVTAFLTKPPVDADKFSEWARGLVDSIDMKLFFGPVSVYCDDPDNEGLTSVTGLTTSHTSMHSWHTVARPFMMFDLYSCKDFNERQVLSLLADEFGADELCWVIVGRHDKGNADLTVEQKFRAVRFHGKMQVVEISSAHWETTLVSQPLIG